MGAARILPVQTEFTNSERIRQDRLQAHAVEAAEQCGGTFVPEVADLQRLDRLLDAWPEDRQLMFCNEAEVGSALRLAANEKGRPPGRFSSARKAGFRTGERAFDRVAIRACGQPWPSYPAGRHGSGGCIDHVAAGVGGLGVIQEASPSDAPAIEAFLAKHPDTSMFLRSNLLAHGIGFGDDDHSTRFFIWGQDRIQGVFGLTKRAT